MSMHFENTVFLGKQCIEKRSLTIGEWIMGRTNTSQKRRSIKPIQAPFIFITFLKALNKPMINPILDPNNTHTAKAVDCCSNISVII